MSTKVWYKEVSTVLDQMGIVYTFEQGKKHTKVWLEKDGKKAMMVISASPSDRRSLMAAKSLARRLVA
jgi:hypothetical protein